MLLGPRLFPTLLGGMLALLSLAGCDDRKSMESLAITQCFESFDIPFSRKDEFHKDEKRRCYGQRWSIPRAYFHSKYVAYNPITETVVIRVGHPGLTPGNLLPSEQVNTLLNDVSIYALAWGTFEANARHIKEAYKITGGLIKTDRVLFDMDVYEQPRVSKDQYRDVFFFPSDNSQLFVSCIVHPGATIDEKNPDGACKVVSNVDDRVRAEYHIRYSQMPDLTRINSKLVGLVRGFMIN